MLNHPSSQESKAKYILHVCLGRFLTIFKVIYLVLAESKIEKQFSSQTDLHCGYLSRCG